MLIDAGVITVKNADSHGRACVCVIEHVCLHNIKRGNSVKVADAHICLAVVCMYMEVRVKGGEGGHRGCALSI